MFVFALFALGTLIYDWMLRAARKQARRPLHRYTSCHPGATQEALELNLLKLIEPLRIVSRVALMLGLVATMIPMGPVLIAVSNGNAQGMAENLVVAFSAVVVLRVELDEAGSVTHASVKTSSGFARLGEAALIAVRTWHCTPAQRHGQPVRAVALQPFKFVLQ